MIIEVVPPAAASEVSQYIIDGIVAVIVAVLAYGATSMVALRRDKRKGRVEDVELFQQVKMAAAEQMKEMRQELTDLRARVDASDEEAKQATRARERMRLDFMLALEHLGRLERILRDQGLTVPDRPALLSDGA